MSQPIDRNLPLDQQPLGGGPIGTGASGFGSGKLEGVGEQQMPQVVTHEPVVQVEHVHHQPVQVQREHHVQPIIHQTQHHVHPVQQTEVTKESPIIQKEETVMHPVTDAGVVPGQQGGFQQGGLGMQQNLGMQQQGGLMGENLGNPDLESAEGVRPVGMGLQEQPLPPQQGLGLGQQGLGLGQQGGLPTQSAVPVMQQQVPFGGVEKQIPITGHGNLENLDAGTRDTTGSGGHSTIGQKIKGTVKQVAGTLTGNQAKKEGGKMLRREGIDPTAPTTQ